MTRSNLSNFNNRMRQWNGGGAPPAPPLSPLEENNYIDLSALHIYKYTIQLEYDKK